MMQRLIVFLLWLWSTCIYSKWLNGFGFSKPKVQVSSREERKRTYAEIALSNLVIALLQVSNFMDRRGDGPNHYFRLNIDDMVGTEGRKEISFLEIKEYRPDIFSAIRERAGLNQDEYFESLLPQNLLFLRNQMDSKSKQYFWKSSNSALIVKTIKHYEHRNLHEMLDIYKQHLLYEDLTSVDRGISSLSNQFFKTSCLGNILGSYRVTLVNKFGRKLARYYVMVNRNIFQQSLCDQSASSLPIKRSGFPIDVPTTSSSKFEPSSSLPIETALRYDLKGSLIGRRKSASSTVFKDVDLLNQNRFFYLSNESKSLLLDTLSYDCYFLQNLNFMDYSLLVEIERPVSTLSALRRFFGWHFTSNISKLRSDRGKLVLLGTDGCIYRFGIIDFLQKYSFRKRLETFFKGIFYDYRKISCVNPKLYAQRFLNFIDHCVRIE